MKVMRNEVFPIQEWLEAHNPDLWEKVSDMTIYDGTVVVCEHYGITSPNEDDLITPDVYRIINELKKHESSWGNINMSWEDLKNEKR